MKFILVSGGLGFIGSHTVIELLMNNYNVIIIDNLINSSINIFHKIIKITNLDNKLRLKFYNIDIRNELQLENLFVNHKIESVIHFASLKAVSESIKNPLQYYYNNIFIYIGISEICPHAETSLMHNINKFLSKIDSLLKIFHHTISAKIVSFF